MATDYISRREFDRTMQERYCFNCKRKGNHPIFGVACKACWVMDMLDEVEQFQSADVVEVVRCKDCKHYKEGKLLGPTKFCYFYQIGTGLNTADYDFCSKGERRADNGN